MKNVIIVEGWRSEDNNALYLEVRCIFPVHIVTFSGELQRTKESASQSRQTNRNLVKIHIAIFWPPGPYNYGFHFNPAKSIRQPFQRSAYAII